MSWVTVMVEVINGDDPTSANVAEWDADCPHELIPVLTDWAA